ncbi:MAG: acyltransferase family protein [Chloroflexi bacterium]|nr:acyltransferase family protein [Chloroflexota bacterium]
MDWARVLAIPTVVSLHVLSPAAFAIDAVSPTAWGFVDLVNSASRWGVPVFVMVSGALLLDPKYALGSTGAFLSRRMRRLLVPLAFWSLVFWWFSVNVRGQDVGPSEFGRRLVAGGSYFHLYFLYIVAGLSLVTPLLRPFVTSASTRVLGLTAAVGLGWAILDRVFLEAGLARSPNGIELFTHYVGYFVAGAWVARIEPSRGWGWLALMVAALGIVTTAIGTWILAHGPGGEHQTFLYTYTSPATVVTSLAVSVAIRVFATAAPRWLPTAARLTFGVYLIHPLTLPWLVSWTPIVSPTTWLPAAYGVQLVVSIAIAGVAAAAFRRLPLARAMV